MTRNEVDFFQTLGVVDTFVRIADVFGQEWRLFISLSMLGYLLSAATMLLIEMILGRMLGAHEITMDSGGVHVHYYNPDPFTWFIFACQSAAYFLIIAIIDGAQIQAVAEMYLGETPSIVRSIKSAFSKAGTLFCVPFLIGLIIIMPFIILMMMVMSGTVYLDLGTARAFQVVSFFVTAFVTIATYIPCLSNHHGGVRERRRQFWSIMAACKGASNVRFMRARAFFHL